ncbi:uncharacterized protein [Amphiura filiformis]|uniref:uncharacterized protein n=1 Tax=Amphiura filiformis TaxID=82378 RepID=UPI003B211EF8
MEKQPSSTYEFDINSKHTMDTLNKVHKSYPKLKPVVEESHTNVAQACQSTRVAFKNDMSYDDFLKGMLFEDEILGSAPIIHFKSVMFRPVTGTECGTVPALKDTMTTGRLYLTDHRILLLSAEEDQGLTFAASSTTNTGRRPREYYLNGGCSDVLHYQCVPLGSIKSVELNARIGISNSAKIVGRVPCCCCLCAYASFACGSFGFEKCLKSWFQEKFEMTNVNQRKLTMGAVLPPWDHKYIIEIDVNTEVPLISVKDFIADLQRFVPCMYTGPIIKRN